MASAASDAGRLSFFFLSFSRFHLSATGLRTPPRHPTDVAGHQPLSLVTLRYRACRRASPAATAVGFPSLYFASASCTAAGAVTHPAQQRRHRFLFIFGITLVASPASCRRSRRRIPHLLYCNRNIRKSVHKKSDN